MTTLTRNDGTQFVVQAYRKLLTNTKKTILSQHVRKIAEQQGQLIRLFKKEPSGYYEAVFSHEPGYLLGESVKHYFNQAQNLVFCEALPNSTDVLVVIIRAGVICLDALIATENLHQKLATFTAEHHPFQIITSGNVPLKEKTAAGGFSLPADLVASFETLEDPLFPRLPTLASFQLLPLAVALKSEHLTSHLTSISMLGVIVVIGFLCWWILSPTKLVIHTRAEQVLPYPAPEKQLDELVQTIQILYGLPGWKASTITFYNNDYKITVESNGGNLEALNTWAKRNHFGYQLTAHGAVLIKHSTLKNHFAPTSIYPNQQVLELIIDQLNELLLGNHVTLERTIKRGDIKETILSINLQNKSTLLLSIIGAQLKNLPITINKISLITQEDSINGTVNISVWGK
ncbi:hypothetical protein [Candidiatus Paracoxiella cheracis]|uniref:hypothetical protein n=1 Tax=Candidiatus Paracoxiella cheracis TaxID=3405120 RepID=UPI003BF5C855